MGIRNISALFPGESTIFRTEYLGEGLFGVWGPEESVGLLSDGLFHVTNSQATDNSDGTFTIS